jgi:threonylcarbamoyladenosine tRNA methylthiotransferase CDKAL1
MSEDALEDLEDLGGALAADGTRVARDLPPVVRVRHRRGADSPRPRAAAPSREGAARDASASSGAPGGGRADDECPEDAVVAARRADRASTSASDAVPLDAATAAGGPIVITGPRVPGTASVHVKTFGCSHNHSDSEFMAGQLQAYGYRLEPDPALADAWVVNTCTVKNPSQSAMNTVIRDGRALNKALVVAGCVPQGDKTARELDGLTLLGVTQIDRVVEAVERTLDGEAVQMLEKKPLPSLDLPKVRKNSLVEILPLSTGCLGQCTYCKTKHARGELGSYAPEALVARAQTAIAEGVSEIWLSSEDTGAYGLDIGTDVTRLLRDLTAVLPVDGSVMLRLGMTNPPYILAHLDAVAEAMRHPGVYAWLHVPVQAGSDAVLQRMRREYVRADFERVADALLRDVPDMTIATDIICGFPGETQEDWEETMRLCRKYEFAELHVSQFYPRPGTPAARMRRVDTAEVKRRSRELTAFLESYQPHARLVGTKQRVWVMDTARDGRSLVAHTKGYVQVLLSPGEDGEEARRLMGNSAIVEIVDAKRWHCVGKVLEIIETERRVDAPESAKEAMAKPAPRGTRARGSTTGAAARASAAARDARDARDAARAGDAEESSRDDPSLSTEASSRGEEETSSAYRATKPKPRGETRDGWEALVERVAVLGVVVGALGLMLALAASSAAHLRARELYEYCATALGARV